MFNPFAAMDALTDFFYEPYNPTRSRSELLTKYEREGAGIATAFGYGDIISRRRAILYHYEGEGVGIAEAFGFGKATKETP